MKIKKILFKKKNLKELRQHVPQEELSVNTLKDQGPVYDSRSRMNTNIVCIFRIVIRVLNVFTFFSLPLDKLKIYYLVYSIVYLALLHLLCIHLHIYYYSHTNDIINITLRISRIKHFPRFDSS